MLGRHRDLVAAHWTSPYGRPGRPGIAKGTTALVVRLAKQITGWGSCPVQGELARTGIVAGPSSVWAISKRHGGAPAPRRSGPTWAALRPAQAKGVTTCDFTDGEPVLARRRFVPVSIHHETGLVRIAGVRATPVPGSVTRQAPHSSRILADHPSTATLSIRDRDASSPLLSTPSSLPRASGPSEPRSGRPGPTPSARVIGTLGRECLDPMLDFGRRHLDTVLAKQVEHDRARRARRAHRTPGQLGPPAPETTPPLIDDVDPAGRRRADPLGDRIHEYPMVA